MAIVERGRIFGVCIALIAGSLFLTAYTGKNPTIGRRGAASIDQLMSPVSQINRGVFDQVFGVVDAYINLQGVKEKNKELQEKISRLETKNLELTEARIENKRLRSLLNLKQQEGLQGITATVISYDPSSWTQGISIDRGYADGVRVGMAVVEGNGIVGQIVATSISSSKVLLLTDHSSGIDAIVQSSRSRGVVEGLGRNRCALRYVTRDEVVSVNDRVISSGADAIYPRGLLIGRVSDVRNQAAGLFQSIEVTPAVDLSRLETVFVISGLTIKPEIFSSEDDFHAEKDGSAPIVSSKTDALQSAPPSQPTKEVQR